MNDLRCAIRQLWKHKGSSLLAILILALGIGGTTAVFSVADKAVLNPIPGRATDRLVRLREVELGRDPGWEMSPPLITELAGHTNVIEALTWWHRDPAEKRLESGDWTLKVSGARVAPTFFDLLELQPVLGRAFLPGEGAADAEPTIVLSHGLWHRRYGGDPQVIGQSIKLDGQTYSVLGIMPASVQFPFGGGRSQFWIPHTFTVNELEGEWATRNREWTTLARLRAGVRLSELRSLLEVTAFRRASSLNEPDQRWIIDAQPARQALSGGRLEQTVWSLMAMMGGLLLIACANVGNLLLSRTVARRGELGIRVAMGAGRWRLARQLLVESLTLAGIAAAVGLFVAWAGIVAFERFYLMELARMQVIGLDWQVLGIGCAVAMLASAILVVGPAWVAGRTNVNQALKETAAQHSGGTFQRVFEDGLVVMQVSVTVVLLAGAGLMTRSVAKLLRVDPGLDARGLYRVFYDANHFMNQPAYDFEAALARGVPRTEAYAELHRVHLERWSAFQRQALERLQAVPGVEMAAVNVGAGYENYEIDGQPGPVELGSASVNVVGGDSLRTLGARLIMGRLLDPADAQPGESGVVINRQMATVCWPGENPLGKLFRRPRGAIEYRVVGVIENIQDWRLDFKATPIFYEPYERNSSAGWSVGDYVIRSPLSAEVLRVGIEEAGNDMLVPVELHSFYSIHDQLLRSTAPRRVMLWLFIVLGGLGLLLSGLGIYAVLAFAVVRRIREVGIRMALGAGRGQIRKLFVRRGARLVINGLVLGLIGGFTGAQYIHGLLFEVDPWDPWAAAAVVLLLVLAAGLACWLPAHRAAKVDPMEALRCE